MAVWSSLVSKNIGKLGLARKLITSLANGSKQKGVNFMPVRNSHERTLVIRDSTYITYKFKDLVYFYFTIGALPLILLVLYANIFIGPAKLAAIPEGYEPEHWEYYQHPISRFIAKYITQSRQELYERSLHTLFFKQEKVMLKELESKIENLMKERQDYQSWYFEKPTAKYARHMKEFSEESEQVAGHSGGWIL